MSTSFQNLFMHNDSQSVGGDSVSSESGLDLALGNIRNAIRKLDEQSGGEEARYSFDASVNDLSMTSSQPLTSLPQRLTPSYNIRKSESPHSSSVKVSVKDNGRMALLSQDTQNNSPLILPIRKRDENGLRKETPPSKAVLTALRAMQGKVQRLEEDKQQIIKKCADLKKRITEIEDISKTKIDNGIAKAKGWTAAQGQLFKRLSENRTGIEKELACMSEESSALSEHVNKAKNQTMELEASRRTLEARATANRDRSIRLRSQVSEAESKASDELVRALSMEATNNERARVLKAKLSAALILKETLSSEVEELENNLDGTEEMLQSVLNITTQVKRINATETVANRKMNQRANQPDPHYSMGTTSSKPMRKSKAHPCVRLPCRSCR